MDKVEHTILVYYGNGLDTPVFSQVAIWLLPTLIVVCKYFTIFFGGADNVTHLLTWLVLCQTCPIEYDFWLE